MNKTLLFFQLILTILLLGFSKEKAVVSTFESPKSWPKPSYNFADNSPTEAGFILGRKLFYDPILSRDSAISCASCHLQYTGFTHVDHAVSHGIEGRKGTRNSPVLINLAWQKHFHWDGGVNHLDAQPINPIEHFTEMDHTLPAVLDKLNRSIVYKQLFSKAFDSEKITTKQLMMALSQFLVQLVSSNSKYDRVMRHEQGVSFTDQEKRGLKLFRKHCSSCHTEPLFTNTFFASNGIPVNNIFNDSGRFKITANPKDSLLFKIPTLRNVEYSFPYMHDGRFKKLKDVLNFYSDSIRPQAFNLHPKLREPLHFSEFEKKDLLAFLLTLTDKEFLYNKRFSFPM
jgi:cytochrome c peroxidase